MVNILQIHKVTLFNIINDRNTILVSRKKIYWWVLIFITAKFFLLVLFSLYFSITQNYGSHWNTCFVIFPFLFLHPFLETTAPWCAPLFETPQVFYCSVLNPLTCTHFFFAQRRSPWETRLGEALILDAVPRI